MSLIFAAALYKVVLFGPEILFWASAIALTVFMLLGVGLTVLSKFFMSPEQGMAQTTTKREMDSTLSTGKLIEDRPFEPVPSVTENTTDLLPKKNKADRK